MVTMKGDGPAIGIDLGTTYSCVAVWRPMQNRVEVIPNDQGNLTTPSCVAFTNTCRLIGDAAVNQAAMNAVNTVFGKYVYLPTLDRRLHSMPFPWLDTTLYLDLPQWIYSLDLRFLEFDSLTNAGSFALSLSYMYTRHHAPNMLGQMSTQPPAPS
jgi:hypothetical protein